MRLHLLLLGTLLGACATAFAGPAAPDDSGRVNPLLEISPLPFHYPRFDLIRDSDYLPAMREGLAEALRAAKAIAADPSPPTFENTIVALERSTMTLSRVSKVYDNLVSANSDDALHEAQRTLAPEIVSVHDETYLDPRLWARVDGLYAQRDQLGLDPESKRLLAKYHLDFVHAGARLDDAGKARLRTLNKDIATLTATFSQNELKEREASAVIFDARADLDGLTDAQIAAAAASADAAGRKGKFRIALENTTGQPLLDQLTRHASREKIMAASLARGSRGGPYDNRAVVADIVRERAERATLLGYRSHADWALEKQTVGGAAGLERLIAQVAGPAVANARRDHADLQALADAESGGKAPAVTAADWPYWAERLRRKRFDFDESQLKPYYELNHVLVDGVFYAATRLYGITFRERHDLPVYDPTVRVFDVFDRDGSPLAIFIDDVYARANKDGGAWMSEYVGNDEMTGDRPVVANHLNIARPPAGQPTLLTQDEVVAAFHEFGHALHGMFMHVKYPGLGDMPTDFVEYPSQFNEMWATDPEVLRHFARHWQTGAAMPQALVDKVMSTQAYGQAYATTEYIAATLLDLAWHEITPAQAPDAAGVTAFEADALRRAHVDFAPVPPRYRSTYFSHIFSESIGYSAGYYSYLWSEVLADDSADWIRHHGGLTRENGDRYRATVLSRGGSEDPLGEFRKFYGGEPEVGPLLARRGLTPVQAAR